MSEYSDASLDLQFIGAIANGAADVPNPGHAAGTATNRTGGTSKTIAKVIGDIETAGEEALAELSAEVVLNPTIAARDATLLAAAQASADADAALMAAALKGVYPLAAASNVPRGVTQAGVGAITGGSGGTNGTFDLAWSGGNFLINPSGTFTVSGGALTAVTMTGPGLYIGSSQTIPTPSFAASAGLTGAGVALLAPRLHGSGEGYWVQSADGLTLNRYNNVSGVATLDSGVEPIRTAKPAPPKVLSAGRTLNASDAGKLLLVNAVAPGPGTPATVPLKIPSHSEYPAVAGTRVEIAKIGGAPVLPVPDEIGDAVIEPQGYGFATDHAPGFVVNVAPDLWQVCGDLSPLAAPLDPGANQIIYDVYDFDTLFQNIEKTIPVTSVGQPVCYVANKGTLGDDADLIAPANNRGYTLEISNGGLKLKRASATSCLLSKEELDLNLATLDFFFDLQVFTHLNQGGVWTFQSSTNSDVNQNDGGYICLGSEGQVSCRFGTPPTVPSVTGSIEKLPHVFEFHKPGNSATATLFCDNSDPSQVSPHSAVTVLTTMARRLIFGARQGNFPATNYVGTFADVGFSRVAGGDVVLTTDQRAQRRVWCESRAYGNLPNYPAIFTLADVAAARELLIDELTGGAGLPSALGTLAADATILSIPSLNGLTGVASVSKMTIPGYDLRPRVFIPTATWNGKIMFSVEGHDAPIGSNGINAQVIQRGMNVGAIVVCFPLPGFVGGNDYTSGDPAEHEADRDNFMEWVGPVAIAANTMLNLYPTANLRITGISGGGWTSTLCAAADVRFSVSVQCVGTLPDYFFLNRDFEQRRGQITADYMTLYLLACADGRVHYLLGHRLDTVGFGDVVLNTRPDFTTVLTAQATTLGGTFSHLRENVAPHAYSVNDGVLLQSLMV